MATAYNEDEIKRFAVRLEEMASNAGVACDCIDQDFRKVCSVLLKYKDTSKGSYSNATATHANSGDPAFDLAMACDQFASAWYGFRATFQSLCIALAADMLGFYEVTAANVGLTREQEEALMKEFESIYASNPELDKASGSPGNHRYVWTKGRTVQELIDNNFVDDYERNYDDRDSSKRVNVTYNGPVTANQKSAYDWLQVRLNGIEGPLGKANQRGSVAEFRNNK